MTVAPIARQPYCLETKAKSTGYLLRSPQKLTKAIGNIFFLKEIFSGEQHFQVFVYRVRGEKIEYEGGTLRCRIANVLEAVVEVAAAGIHEERERGSIAN